MFFTTKMIHALWIHKMTIMKYCDYRMWRNFSFFVQQSKRVIWVSSFVIIENDKCIYRKGNQAKRCNLEHSIEIAISSGNEGEDWSLSLKTPIPSKTVSKHELGKLRTSLLKATGLYIADGLCVRLSKVAYSPLALEGTLNWRDWTFYTLRHLRIFVSHLYLKI